LNGESSLFATLEAPLIIFKGAVEDIALDRLNPPSTFCPVAVPMATSSTNQDFPILGRPARIESTFRYQAVDNKLDVRKCHCSQ